MAREVTPTLCPRLTFCPEMLAGCYGFFTNSVSSDWLGLCSPSCASDRQARRHVEETGRTRPAVLVTAGLSTTLHTSVSSRTQPPKLWRSGKFGPDGRHSLANAKSFSFLERLLAFSYSKANPVRSSIFSTPCSLGDSSCPLGCSRSRSKVPSPQTEETCCLRLKSTGRFPAQTQFR